MSFRSGVRLATIAVLVAVSPVFGCGKADPKVVSGVGSAPLVLAEANVNLCTPPPPPDPVDLTDPDLPPPNPEAPPSSTPGPGPGAPAPVTEIELEAAIEVLRADPDIEAALLQAGTVIKLADPWIDKDNTRRGAILTVLFEQGVSLPVQEEAYVDVPDPTPQNEADNPEAPDIVYDESGAPELAPTDEGAFLFNAARTAWFTVDLTTNTLFYTQTSEAADFHPCPWDA